MRRLAEDILKVALNNEDASFRDGQWESIEALLNKKRILVVQRTGWGKSMVYFLATKLLRQRNAGPTLLISPLLSLMRNQLLVAERMGLKACMIDSTNNEQWATIRKNLLADKVDVLLITPERLSNQEFCTNILGNVIKSIGLLVVDEAHCISDWGHDFRPDYRRIVRIIQAIPSNVPVLATTATANNRVVEDVKAQLGQDIIIKRGTLVRKSLKLQNINMPSSAARMAWLAKTIPNLPRSGIIYTLTAIDAEKLANWLRFNQIEAECYHARLSSEEKERLELRLLDNEIKVLVATVALGMGFDKPDLGFVIHYQRPASVVHYYQQVGRAGRSVDDAYGILLCGEEDDDIANYFISHAFPPQKHIFNILKLLYTSEVGLSIPQMLPYLNLTKEQIKNTLKYLTAESPSPVVKDESKWYLTAAINNYEIDEETIETITKLREAEQIQMRDYMEHKGCLMNFLQNALDDPSHTPCGRCKNCNPSLSLDETFDNNLANTAALFLRRSYSPILPRKQWPKSNMFSKYLFSGYRITSELLAEEGRALCTWRDAGWGQLVSEGKYESGYFDDELVEASVEMIMKWNPTPKPEWVTCIPSLNRPELVPNFASRLADALGIPFVPCIIKIRQNDPQKLMENSYQQVKNLDGAFNVVLNQGNYPPCLLVDDVVDSRWTFTVASALLRQKGVEAVYPMALALNSLREDL